MRRLFAILGLLVVLAFVAGTIFLITFDVDHYRPLVTQRLEGFLGKPVKLERLSLGWQGGLVLEAKGLSVYPDAQAKADPSVRLERASVVFRLLPLLKRDFQVASVGLFQPTLILEASGGTLQVKGVALPKAEPVKARSARVGSTSVSEGARPLGGVAFLVREVVVKDGSLRIDGLALKFGEAFLLRRADATLRNVSLSSPIDFKFKFGLWEDRQNATLMGRTGALATDPWVYAKLTLDRVPLEPVFPSGSAGEPSFTGKLSGEWEAKTQGPSASEWLANLQSQGRFFVSEGVVRNFNLLQGVFGRFTILPGLTEILLSRLDPVYREKFLQQDTPIQKAELTFRISEGGFRFDSARIETDSAQLVGSATVGFKGQVQAKAILHVEPELSQAMAASVKELGLLRDPQGRLEFPVVISGTFPKLIVMPDVGYLASRLVATKAEELIGGILEKVLE